MTDLEQPANTGGSPEAPPPSATLTQMLFGALVQKSICVAVQLGVPDLLGRGPQSAEELGEKTHAHAPSLFRVLRMLASAGVFAQTPDHKFGLTPISELLRSDVPDSMHGLVMTLGEDWAWRNWGELMHSVKTGQTGQQKAHGMGLFELFEQNPEAAEMFNGVMTSLSRAVAPALVGAYDFTGVGRLADIAGGHGMLLAAILKANPQMQGVLFDLPSVLEGAGEVLEQEGVRSRVELASGDFFQSVPAGADVYMMMNIIHDWDDACCLTILKNVYTAMQDGGKKDGGKVLIIQSVVPETGEPHYSKMIDLEMLVSVGGKERTEEEYRRLLEASGFRMTRVIPTMSPFHMIEGEPA